MLIAEVALEVNVERVSQVLCDDSVSAVEVTTRRGAQ
jgi:hypothetical protein